MSQCPCPFTGAGAGRRMKIDGARRHQPGSDFVILWLRVFEAVPAGIARNDEAGDRPPYSTLLPCSVVL